jgi:hypothetical protein
MENTPAIYTDRARQLRGLITFATKAEKAYRSCGQNKNADQAKAHREQCEKELAELEQK